MVRPAGAMCGGAGVASAMYVFSWQGIAARIAARSITSCDFACDDHVSNVANVPPMAPAWERSDTTSICGSTASSRARRKAIP